MHAIKTHFDGKKVVLPRKTMGLSPRDVFVIFEDATNNFDSDKDFFLATGDSTLHKVWSNNEDAIYDSL